MIEVIAYTIICFIICNHCTSYDRWKKAGGGTILFVALFQSYNILQPLLPTEIDHLLHSTIWGVLFAYAVPNQTKGTDKKNENHDEDKKVDDDSQEEPNSTLN
jgi:hypothetical protein